MPIKSKGFQGRVYAIDEEQKLVVIEVDQPYFPKQSLRDAADQDVPVRVTFTTEDEES